MKLLRTNTIVVTSALLLSLALASCQFTPTPQNSVSSQDTSVASQEPVSGEGQASGQDASEPGSNAQQVPTALDPAEEPPLSKEDLEIAVPDFLTDDQKLLYRRAHSLYEHLNGDSVEYAETLGMDPFPAREYERITLHDTVYTIAQGRFADWTEFDAVGKSIFTKDCWDRLNRGSDGLPLRMEYEGKLCFLDTSIGGGYYFCENVPDCFRLDKQEEKEIEFTLIGHYRYFDGMTEKDRAQFDAQGYNYTLEFPMKLLLTDDGWRFDEFHSSLLEEGEPVQ